MSNFNAPFNGVKERKREQAEIKQTFPSFISGLVVVFLCHLYFIHRDWSDVLQCTGMASGQQF